MRNFLVSLFVVFGLLIIGGLMFIYSGLFDVAANDTDWPVMRWGLQTTRMRSIKFHAAGIQAPPGLDDPAKLLIGTEHPSATAHRVSRKATSQMASIRNPPILPMHPTITPRRSCSGSSNTGSR